MGNIYHGTFIGTDGSCGFKKGHNYRLKITLCKGFVRVFDIDKGHSCPYGSWNALLNNWSIEL